MSESYSIIIPTYNRLETLKTVLTALGRQDAPELVGEIVVVDDGSQDGTAEWVRGAELPFPTVVLEGRRGGPAAARNAGIEAASGRWALFLCDDIEATPGLLRAHHQARASDPSCAVQGPVDWPPGTHVTHFMRFAIKHYHWHFADYTDLQELPARHFITSNASAELATLRALGGFDPGFTYGYEDTDLGLRMEKAGVRLHYAERAVAYHHHQIDLYSYSRREEAVGRSAAHFAQKWPEHPSFTGVRKLPGRARGGG